jgi:hypothetical protein
MFVLVDKQSVSKFRTYFIQSYFSNGERLSKRLFIFQLYDNGLALVQARASIEGVCRTLADFSLPPMYGTPGTSASTLFLNT